MASSTPLSPAVPEGCVLHGLFDKRQHSKLSTNRISRTRAVRGAVKLGAVTAKYDRRWFCLLDTGVLQWNGEDALETDVDSCSVLRALVSSSKELLLGEVGFDFDENAAPFYILVATATRRLTLRMESSAERDRWHSKLAELAGSSWEGSLGQPQVKLVSDAETIFALAPMHWSANPRRGGQGQMIIGRTAFRALCEKHSLLGDPFTVDSIFDGLIEVQSHADGLTFDRFLNYVKTLVKSTSDPPPSFELIKLSLKLNPGEPLVRTEELVQSQTPSLLLSNGTLFLTDRFLVHQAWNLETIHVIPLDTIKKVEGGSSSALLSLNDTLVLVGVDVFAVNMVSSTAEDPLTSSVPQRDVRYTMQFSVLKDMLLSSGEEKEHGGRRGLWADLLTEFAHGHAIVKTMAHAPSALHLPSFVAVNMVRSRAVFRSSGHYSKDLLMCTNHAAGDELSVKVISGFVGQAPRPVSVPLFWVTSQAKQPLAAPAEASVSPAATPTAVAASHPNSRVGGAPAAAAAATTAPSRPPVAPLSRARRAATTTTDSSSAIQLSGSGYIELWRVALSLVAIAAALAFSAPRKILDGESYSSTCASEPLHVLTLSPAPAAACAVAVFLLRR